MLLSLFSIVLAVPADNHEWMAPSPTALRSPCPGLNTLANYGYLPRDGGQTRGDDIAKYGSEVYGLGINALKMVLDGALKQGILTQTSQGAMLASMQVLSLSHGKIEHDASLSRPPIGNVDQSKQNPLVDNRLVDKLISYSSDGKYLTMDELSKAQADTIIERKASIPNYYADDFNINGEKAVLALVLGDKFNSWRIRVDWLEEFLRFERLPKDWKKQETNQIEFFWLIKQFGDKIKAFLN
jgi:hypothetical protein